jgi:hypothetical protein
MGPGLTETFAIVTSGQVPEARLARRALGGGVIGVGEQGNLPDFPVVADPRAELGQGVAGEPAPPESGGDPVADLGDVGVGELRGVLSAVAGGPVTQDCGAIIGHL